MLAYLNLVLRQENVGQGKGQGLDRTDDSSPDEVFYLLEESIGLRSSLTLRRSFRTLQLVS